MSSNTNQNISSKLCVYGCGINLYFNTSTNEYWEVFTKKKHVCPNRSNQQKSTIYTHSVNNKPNYYNKFTKQPKPKMSNSLELLTGPISEVQKKYELLSDIVTEYNGHVHGSQSHILPNNTISLVVYYESPAEGNTRDLIKQQFKSIVLHNR